MNDNLLSSNNVSVFDHFFNDCIDDIPLDIDSSGILPFILYQKIISSFIKDISKE